tara:strand:+ start:204 stop:500 length:297 start_codon:yes stop_codon:yes gene_type:complete
MGFWNLRFTDLWSAYQRERIKEANEDALYELKKQTREITRASKQATQDQMELHDQMVVNELETFQDPSSDNLEMLKIRLAKGEITIDEYNEIKTALKS